MMLVSANFTIIDVALPNFSQSFLDVGMNADDEVTLNDIVVEIERCTLKKPFLGGYRHKETGVEFHHASAQTNKKVKRQCHNQYYFWSPVLPIINVHQLAVQVNFSMIFNQWLHTA